jgi:prepilin-type N-terminal cleavage/methylation domain-containing protein
MNRKRSGFTLMELVVVVAILAALAGLVINKVDWIRRQANMAMGAEASGDVAQNIQTYIATTERLPSGLDSLITSGTSQLYSGPGGTGSGGGIIGQIDGVGNIPSQTAIATTTYSSTDKSLNSLFRVGMNFVNDHSATASNANDSGTVLRTIGTISGGASSFTSGQFVYATTGSAIWNAVYPQNVWGASYVDAQHMIVNASGVTVSLVCLGIGPGNSMMGSTMVSPPQYAGPNSNIYYYRYIAVFAVYSDGSRAQLKTVIDPYGRTIDSSIQQYSTSGPDDLPIGSRTPE